MAESADESAEPHYFAFSRHFDGNDRLCADCHQAYAAGPHRAVENLLRPRTHFVCPSGEVDGHSGVYTGALHPELRRPGDDHCICGRQYVEEDNETWRLTFETQTPLDPEWHTVSVVRSRHAAQAQRDGLLSLIEQGEPIRNVELYEVQEVRRG